MRTLQGYVIVNKSLGNGHTYVTHTLDQLKSLYFTGPNQNVFVLKSTAKNIMNDYNVSKHKNVWQTVEVAEFWS